MTIGLTDQLTPLGSFPIVADDDVSGGLHTVADTTERDNIHSSLRKAGMLVWSQADSTMYQLGSGLTNGDWTTFSSGATYDFVYDPLATPVDNIYDTFSTAVAAANAAVGLKRVVLKGDATVTTGAITLTDITLESSTSGAPKTITFSGTSSLTKPPRELSNVVLVNDKTSSLCTLTANETVLLSGSGSLQVTASGAPVLNLDSYTLNLCLRDRASLTNAHATAGVLTSTNNGALYLVVSTGCSINCRVLSSGGTWSTLKVYLSNGTDTFDKSVAFPGLSPVFYGTTYITDILVDSSATASTNVFSSFARAASMAASIPGLVRILMRQSEDVTSGAYNLRNVILEGVSTNNTVPVLGSQPLLRFMGTSSWTGLPREIRSLRLGLPDGPSYSLYSSGGVGSIDLQLDRAYITDNVGTGGSAGATFINLNGDSLYIEAKQSTLIGGSSTLSDLLHCATAADSVILDLTASSETYAFNSTSHASSTVHALYRDEASSSNTASGGDTFAGTRIQEVLNHFRLIPTVGTVTLDDYCGNKIFSCDTSSAPVSITLPSILNLTSKQPVIIADRSGNATSNKITVNPASLETIAGASSFTLDKDYGSVTLQALYTGVSDPKSWSLSSDESKNNGFSLVLDLAATPSGNVYNTLPSVLAAANLLDGIVLIEVMTSLSVSSGTFNFSNTILRAGVNGTLGEGLTITFLGTAHLTFLPLELDHIQLINQKTTGSFLTLSASPPPLVIRKNGGLISNTVTLHAIDINSHLVDIYAYDDSVLTGNSATGLLFTTNSTGTINFYTLSPTFRATNAYVFGGNITLNVFYGGGNIVNHTVTNPFTSLTGSYTLSDYGQKIPFIFTPTTISSSQNNYNPTGLAWADTLRLNASSAVNINGIEAASWVTNKVARGLTLTNVGSNNITLTHQNGSGTYPFFFPNTQAVILVPGASISLYFDPTSSYWRPTGSVAGPSPVVTLTDAVTVTIDATQGPNFEWTIGGNRTLANPTNSIAGQRVLVAVKQDGTGGWGLTFGANWVAIDSTATLDSSVGNVTLITADARAFGGTVKWYYSMISLAELGNSLSVVTLTDAVTVTPNAALGSNFEWTIAGNRTLANPTGGSDGQRLVILVKQDATGGRTITYGSNWVAIDTTTAIDTTASSVSRIEADARSFSGTTKWYYTVISLAESAIGEVNDGTNLGAGAQVFTSKSGVNLQFRSFIGSTGITVTQNTNDITITSADTAANLGSGTGVFSAKSGAQFQFKSLQAGYNQTLSSTSTEITIAEKTAVTTLTDAATISINADSGPHYQVTLAGNRTLGNPTNSAVGKKLRIAVKQDATGGRSLAFDTNWVAVDGTTGLDLTASNVSMVTADARDFGGGVLWYYVVTSQIETGGSGESNTASNVGTGSGVFKQKIGVDLEFKSFIAGSNVSVTPGTNDITIAATGEANTASNLGAGTGVFASKSGVDLRFKSLLAGYGSALSNDSTTITVADKTAITTLTDAVTIAIDASVGPNYQVTLAGDRTLGNPTNSADGQHIIIAVKQDATGGRNLTFSSNWVTADPYALLDTTANAVSLVYAEARGFGGTVKYYYWVTSFTDTGGGGGEANTASNVGSGTGIFKQKTGVDLELKSLVQGTNITITGNTSDVTIATTAEINAGANLGSGSGVYASKSGVNLQFKSIGAGYGSTVSATGTDITVARKTTVTTLTDGATISIDASVGPNYQVSIAGNRTLSNPTNSVAGHTIKILVLQDATGGRTLTFGTNWIAVDPTVIVDPDPSAVTLIEAEARDFGSGIKWYFFMTGLNEASSLGETNTASNLGTGAGVFALKSGVDLQFKSLIAGSNITITPTANDLTIATSSTGETNTASNLGSGAGVFSAKVGVDLRFKSLLAGYGLAVTTTSNDITYADKIATTALTDGATIAVDASVGPNYKVTVAGDRTLSNPTNSAEGQMIFIAVTQDATGGRQLSFAANWIVVGDIYEIAQTASATSLIVAKAFDTGGGVKWYYFITHGEFGYQSTPTQLTASVDDYSPSRWSASTVVRLSSNASRDIQAFSASASVKRKRLWNVGSNSIVLKHEDVTSATPANRISCPGSTDITMVANDAVDIEYDNTTQRWRVS